jgi:hypothetical protein
MLDSTTSTAICTRLAAQDRHDPKESVPLALSSFASRRGWVGRISIRAHLTALAAESTIRAT